jgi:protein-disulfide isomerase
MMNRRQTMLAALALASTGALAGLPAWAQEAAEIDTSMVQDMSIGNPDATVTVIEYASFTCPHCAAFHADTFKSLKADYIDTGKINFIYRDVYFDRPGLWAAIVARCGDGAENRFFGIADIIYSKQREWSQAGSPQDIVDQLRTIGKTAGLTDAQLDSCFTDADNAQALYAYYLKNAEEDAITSTPSFVINGRKYSNMPYDEMKEILDAALSG